MKEPIRKMRYVYAIPVNGTVVRGNTKAHSADDVRTLLSVVHGKAAAQQAQIETFKPAKATRL